MPPNLCHRPCPLRPLLCFAYVYLCALCMCVCVRFGRCMSSVCGTERIGRIGGYHALPTIAPATATAPTPTPSAAAAPALCQALSLSVYLYICHTHAHTQTYAHQHTHNTQAELSPYISESHLLRLTV